MSQTYSVVFALYPRITQLDFTGPFEVFSRLPDVECIVASVEGGSLEADSRLTFANLRRLDAVERCALLFVPGGFGVSKALEDAAYLGELRRLAKGAEYVTSVCTGSLLLGAAGLLRGRRAGCHWAWRDQLAAFGAMPDSARVVTDGNLITGGGITAGIDMALTVMAQIAGPDYAQETQLMLEYAPAPPFDCGRPDLARPAILDSVEAKLQRYREQRAVIVQRAAAALNARSAPIV